MAEHEILVASLPPEFRAFGIDLYLAIQMLTCAQVKIVL